MTYQSDVAVVSELLDVGTGEFLEPSIPNAALVLVAAREMKGRINDVIANATAYLTAQTAHQGTKTFHYQGGTIVLSGGPTTDYDPVDLMEALRMAGCPEERIGEAVVETVSYKVNRAVLRQLAGANPDYKAAIAIAERQVEKPVYVSLKGPA